MAAAANLVVIAIAAPQNMISVANRIYALNATNRYLNAHYVKVLMGMLINFLNRNIRRVAHKSGALREVVRFRPNAHYVKKPMGRIITFPHTTVPMANINVNVVLS